MDEQRMISIHPDLLPISFIDRPVGSGSHAQLSARCRVDQDVDHLGCVAEIVLELKDLFAQSREYEAAIIFDPRHRRETVFARVDNLSISAGPEKAYQFHWIEISPTLYQPGEQGRIGQRGCNVE